MNPRAALSTFYDANVFEAEIINGTLLAFLMLFVKYLCTTVVKKVNFLTLPILFATAYFISIVTTWAFLRFTSANAFAVFYLSPINVIIQSFFQGITKDFTGTPLIAGVWYILGGHFLGSLLGATLFLFVAWLIKNYHNPPKCHNLKEAFAASAMDLPPPTQVCCHRLVVKSPFLTQMATWKNKLHQTPFAYSIELAYLAPKVPYWKFGLKEMFFIFLLTLTAPFYGYISQPAFGTTIFINYLIVVVSIFLLLAFSLPFGLFMFNFHLKIINNLFILLFRPWQWRVVIETMIGAFWSIAWGLIFAIVLLKIANNTGIAFNL